MSDGVSGTEATRRTRYAGPGDLSIIARLGKDVLRGDNFYSESELAGYLAAQRDAIWLFELGYGEQYKLGGYAVILALKPATVERIKAGRILRGRDILPNDLEHDLDATDAVYVGMLHDLERRRTHTVSNAVVGRILESDRRRRPQLLLARGTSDEGRAWMKAHGFDKFGLAPIIRGTYSDSAAFRAIANLRGIS